MPAPLPRRHRTARAPGCRRRTAAVLVAAVLATGCSADAGVQRGPSDSLAPAATTDDPATTVPATADSLPAYETTIEWEPFGVDSRVETGTIDVPFDYADPSRGTFTLHVARHLADPEARLGSLLVNPGGPGFGGSDFAVFADQVYADDLLRHFDIVGWDPRGTGRSEPAIDCFDDYDHFFAGTDITPDTAAERRQLVDLAEELADACARENADILPYIGTNNSARDIDTIRRALGEETISYFGFSYGSELGATWMTMFPDTVRAAVLDGAADPTAGFTGTGLQQAEGFEATLETFLDECSRDTTCRFHRDGDSAAAFDALMERLDETPVPSVDGRPPVTRSMALTAVAMAMYDDDLWEQLARALDEADYGEGGMLLRMYDSYYQRRADGSYDNALEAFQVIVCMDQSERSTVSEEDEAAATFRKAAPRFSPGTTGSYFCTFFPPSTDPRITVGADTQVPVVVIGTTGDPATPLEGSRTMARTLGNAVLLVVEANTHTGYGTNGCVNDAVGAYLIDPTEPPKDGTRC